MRFANFIHLLLSFKPLAQDNFVHYTMRLEEAERIERIIKEKKKNFSHPLEPLLV